MLLNITVASRGFSEDGTAIEWHKEVQNVWDMVGSFSGIMDQVTSELTNFLGAAPDGKSIEMYEVKLNEGVEEWIAKQAEKYY